MKKLRRTPWGEHGRRIRRRCITIPVLFCVTFLLIVSLPLSMLLLGLLDLVAPTRPWARSRAVLSITWIAFCEVVGVIAAILLWLFYLLHRNPQRFLAHNSALQRAWTSALFSGATRIFKMRLELSGLAEAQAGPILLLVRHASLVDTVLTAAVLANPARLRLRYVLKSELLNDPCIDIVGNRLPNAFVFRSAGSSSEIEKVRELADDLSSDEGVLIYPEGTRFSQAKLQKMQARLAEDALLGPHAAQLQHVLPPRPKGTLALLQQAPEADVVILAHKGLEGAATLGDFWRGQLVESTLYAHAWRIKAEDIPLAARESPEWLLERWQEVDAWIHDHSQSADLQSDNPQGADSQGAEA